MQALQLSQGIYALLDDDTYSWLRHWNWSVAKSKKYRYARRKTIHPTSFKSTFVYLHKLIAGVSDDFKVSFRDKNPLNMQRDNIRITNGLDQEILWDGSRCESLFAGVVWDMYYGLWRASLEGMVIGYFITEFDAALAYNSKFSVIRPGNPNLNNLESVCQPR